MTTVDDFAQGMLREYSAFAGRCAALVAEHGDEEAAAMLYLIDDLPQIAEQLRAFRVRAEAAEAALAAARAEGEAAGRAAERADVVEWLMRTEWADEEAYHIEAGKHVGAAGGGAR